MKTHIALMMFVITSHLAIAQEKSTADETKNGKTKRNEVSRRKGYIGISLGPSFPLGDFAKKENFAFGTGLTGPEKTSVGLQLNLINFGYLFSEHVGISAAWFGAAYNRTGNRGYELDPWSCGGLMVGPLFSFPMSEKVEWDLRAMFGRSVCSGQPENGGTSTVETNSALIFNIGSVHRVHLSKRISLLLSADFFSTKLKFKDYGANWPGADEQTIKALSLGLGLAVRLR
jgi:hypothetical protein